MAAIRSLEWFRRTRFERLASVIYPAHTDDDTRRQMNQLAANERKNGPVPSPLLSHGERGATSPLGGAAKWGK